MAVLASRITSIVVGKRDDSSLRDVEIIVPSQVYRACMGWGGGKRETNNAKSVQESLSAAWLDS